MSYAEVLIPQKIVKGSSTLSYEIPTDLKEIKVGHLVKIPLRNSVKTGIVWNIHNDKPAFKTLPIKSLVTAEPLLQKNSVLLANWISNYYFCPLHQVIKLFIPKRFFNEKKERKTKNIDEQKNSPHTKDESKIELNKDQLNAFTKITNSSKNNFLIHGVTGSGKTEIYTRLSAHYIKEGFQSLILIPEISLTPQTLSYFENALNLKAEVINSRLSDIEKKKCWERIASGEAKLVIGSRSAIFAPFKNLGIIIVDEEHDASYKQDKSPRYFTHAIIEKIQEFSPHIKAVFGSATPTVEMAEKLKGSTLHLKKRIGNVELPEIKIVDLREEFHKKNYSIFSDTLHMEIAKTLENHEQLILFINRRGSASSVVCRDCGFTAKCSCCDSPLTYHLKTANRPLLICHHCGKVENPPENCPICSGPNIRYLGIGTQRIEDEVKKAFPNARVLRADRDSTANKEGFKKIYDSFKNREADILVGTQMIAKGLDLPNVNLVGVVLADIGLNIPDFRSIERNFELITQVSGRAGRRETRGKVIIQTYNPDNIALKFSQEQDYEKFFNYEIKERKILENPPFSRLAKILIQSDSFIKSQNLGQKIETMLWKIAREQNFTEELEILLYPAYILRLRKKYRHILLIKDKKNDSQNSLIHKLLEFLPEEYIMQSDIRIDIDPLQIT